MVAFRRLVLPFGTLLATAEVFVNRSPRGYFAHELARALHVAVQDALHQLTEQHRDSHVGFGSIPIHGH
ncbi:MAG: hypothetical protein DMG57_10310 [Acidobacteria bacterium]|nr:MAG: hypothetical protein DMG57_10310 [Acidobacteriota bacterium]